MNSENIRYVLYSNTTGKKEVWVALLYTNPTVNKEIGKPVLYQILLK